jgi:hypothetical protein
MPKSGSYYPSKPGDTYTLPANGSAQNLAYPAPHPYISQRQPVFVRNASKPNKPQSQQSQQATPARENNLIGPIGYEQ